MLNIIYGRENINKEKFAFEYIGEEAIIIVPEQYTLEGEKDALKYLKRKGLSDTQVISFSRLGTKIFQKTGAPLYEIIDKQGRHILLTKIVKEVSEEFLVFANQKGKSAFIEMANNTISQLKQNGISPLELGNIVGNLEENRLLTKKLKDIGLVFEKYENEIQNRYTDSEDLIDLYIDKIKDWEDIKNKEILIYGFDYFTPKNLKIIGEILKYAKEVNIVLTLDENRNSRDYDTFSITRRMKNKLLELAMAEGINYKEIDINGAEKVDTYLVCKSKELAHLEKEIFALPFETYNGIMGNIKLVKAANLYLEAESAASYILELTRDKGYKFGDIVIICNDLSKRGEIYERVFKKYNIDIFMDQKEGIKNQPLIRYITSLINIFANGFRREEVIAFAKTSLTKIDEDEIEVLEQYVNKYGITGKKWRKEFPVWEENIEEWEYIEKAREKIITPLLNLEGNLKNQTTCRGKLEEIYRFLKEDAEIPKQLEIQVDNFSEENRNEEALILAQMWSSIIKTFTQVIEVAGDEKMTIKEIGELLKSGFEEISLGAVPPTADISIMGTVQRTRTGDAKALIIMGANEGILPRDGDERELLTEEEKEELLSFDMNFVKLKSLKREEEELAIYKMISKATDNIWISYGLTDDGGSEEKSSQVFEKIREIFPQIIVEEDIENRGKEIEMVSAKNSTSDFLSKKLRRVREGEKLDDLWKEVLRWFEENEKETIDRIRIGLEYNNKVENIEESQLDKIYGSERRVSPSRVELYARCPFAQFVRYGLKPKNKKKFTVEAVDAGSIYHEVLMIFAREIEANKDNSMSWSEVTREFTDKRIGEILNQISKSYRDGLLNSNEEERDKARRIVSVCQESAWAMVSHVQKGVIESMLFEQSFGKGEKIPPITIELDESQQIYIEGKIDRVDNLPENFVKIIDYKSSKVKYNKEKAKAGWAVQLFLYMKAAAVGEKKAAGAFYFYVDHPMIDIANKKEDIFTQVMNQFKMDGIMVSEKNVLEWIDGSLKEASAKSQIISMETTKNSKLSSKNKEKVLEEEEFNLIREEVFQKVTELCKDIFTGKIQIEPTKIGSVHSRETGCDYCDYRGICQIER